MNLFTPNVSEIIKKYLDYSLDNLTSKLSKIKKYNKLHFKKDITFSDIFFRCFKRGYVGFYISYKCESLMAYIFRIIIFLLDIIY